MKVEEKLCLDPKCMPFSPVCVCMFVNIKLD